MIVRNDIVCSTDHGFVSALVLSDLSAAFDTVDHEFLMNILSDRFSIAYDEVDWVRSYHSVRLNTLKTPVDSSGSVPLTSSVPQGSVLGPQEFIEYTEDNHHLYADDSQLLNHMRLEAVMEHRRRLETCVGNLKDWCSSRRLQLNPDKTELIWLGSIVNLSKLKRLNVMSLTLCAVAIRSRSWRHS